MSLSNRLFAFVPSSEWVNCGGIVLIVAPTLEGAIGLANEQQFKKHPEHLNDRELFTQNGNGVMTWRYHCEWSLSSPVESGIVLFNYNYVVIRQNIPVVISFTPSIAAPGVPVVLTGINFIGTTSVTFGGTEAIWYHVNSDTQITAIVPVCVTGPITVTSPGGIGSSSTDFIYFSDQINLTSTKHWAKSGGTQTISKDGTGSAPTIVGDLVGTWCDSSGNNKTLVAPADNRRGTRQFWAKDIPVTRMTDLAVLQATSALSSNPIARTICWAGRFQTELTGYDILNVGSNQGLFSYGASSNDYSSLSNYTRAFVNNTVALKWHTDSYASPDVGPSVNITPPVPDVIPHIWLTIITTVGGLSLYQDGVLIGSDPTPVANLNWSGVLELGLPNGIGGGSAGSSECLDFSNHEYAFSAQDISLLTAALQFKGKCWNPVKSDLYHSTPTGAALYSYAKCVPLSDGRIFAALRLGGEQGDIYVSYGTFNTDRTITWTTPSLIIPKASPTSGSELFAVFRTSTGRLLITWYYQPYGSKIAYSDDNGETWTSVVIPDFTGYSLMSPISNIVEDPDGTILLAFSGATVAPPNNWASLLGQSTDRGLTWTLRSTIADGATVIMETVLVSDPTTKHLVMAAYRYSEIGTYRRNTPDHGMTWGGTATGTELIPGRFFVQMDYCICADGLMIISGNDRTALGGFALTSRDGGTTWNYNDLGKRFQNYASDATSSNGFQQVIELWPGMLLWSQSHGDTGNQPVGPDDGWKDVDIFTFGEGLLL